MTEESPKSLSSNNKEKSFYWEKDSPRESKFYLQKPGKKYLLEDLIRKNNKIRYYTLFDRPKFDLITLKNFGDKKDLMHLAEREERNKFNKNKNKPFKRIDKRYFNDCQLNAENDYKNFDCEVKKEFEINKKRFMQLLFMKKSENKQSEISLKNNHNDFNYSKQLNNKGIESDYNQEDIRSISDKKLNNPEKYNNYQEDNLDNASENEIEYFDFTNSKAKSNENFDINKGGYYDRRSFLVDNENEEMFDSQIYKKNEKLTNLPKEDFYKYFKQTTKTDKYFYKNNITIFPKTNKIKILKNISIKNNYDLKVNKININENCNISFDNTASKLSKSGSNDFYDSEDSLENQEEKFDYFSKNGKVSNKNFNNSKKQKNVFYKKKAENFFDNKYAKNKYSTSNNDYSKDYFNLICKQENYKNTRNKKRLFNSSYETKGKMKLKDFKNKKNRFTNDFINELLEEDNSESENINNGHNDYQNFTVNNKKINKHVKQALKTYPVKKKQRILSSSSSNDGFNHADFNKSYLNSISTKNYNLKQKKLKEKFFNNLKSAEIKKSKIRNLNDSCSSSSSEIEYFFDDRFKSNKEINNEFNKRVVNKKAFFADFNKSNLKMNDLNLDSSNEESQDIRSTSVHSPDNFKKNFLRFNSNIFSKKLKHEANASLRKKKNLNINDENSKMLKYKPVFPLLKNKYNNFVKLNSYEKEQEDLIDFPIPKIINPQIIELNEDDYLIPKKNNFSDDKLKADEKIIYLAEEPIRAEMKYNNNTSDCQIISLNNQIEDQYKVNYSLNHNFEYELNKLDNSFKESDSETHNLINEKNKSTKFISKKNTIVAKNSNINDDQNIFITEKNICHNNFDYDVSKKEEKIDKLTIENFIINRNRVVSKKPIDRELLLLDFIPFNKNLENKKSLRADENDKFIYNSPVKFTFNIQNPSRYYNSKELIKEANNLLKNSRINSSNNSYEKPLLFAEDIIEMRKKANKSNNLINNLSFELDYNKINKYDDDYFNTYLNSNTDNINIPLEENLTIKNFDVKNIYNEVNNTSSQDEVHKIDEEFLKNNKHITIVKSNNKKRKKRNKSNHEQYSTKIENANLIENDSEENRKKIRIENRSKKKCLRCNRPKHTDTNNECTEKIDCVCSNCGNLNHTAETCLINKFYNNKSNINVKIIKEENIFSNVLCMICGVSGHAFCPMELKVFEDYNPLEDDSSCSSNISWTDEGENYTSEKADIKANRIKCEICYKAHMTKDCNFPKNAFKKINNCGNFLFEHKQRIAYRREYGLNNNDSDFATSYLINEQNFLNYQNEFSD